MKDHGSLPLKNTPLQYAPDGERGVVYLFANIAKKLQFRIEEIRAAYPDCIAYNSYPTLSTNLDRATAMGASQALREIHCV